VREPPPEPGFHLYSTATERHVEGERRIWVLWSGTTLPDRRSEYYWFEAFSLDSLPRIRKEIAEYRDKRE
jgi:hypothetical protein